MRIQLMTADPTSYIRFCLAHPVNMCDALAHETRNGGQGDLRPPSPAAEEFFTLLALHHGKLPTQGEYADYCCAQWAPWFHLLSPYQQQCFRARLYRNFYPSFVDSLHVWALLGTRYYANDTLVFDRCLIDTQQDVHLKTDLLAYRGEECLHIALRVDTAVSYLATRVKAQRDTVPNASTIVITLPIKGRQKIGGKRWYVWPHDFRQLQKKVEQLWLPFA